jgi:hypothetical protein
VASLSQYTLGETNSFMCPALIPSKMVAPWPNYLPWDFTSLSLSFSLSLSLKVILEFELRALCWAGILLIEPLHQPFLCFWRQGLAFFPRLTWTVML